MVAWQSQEADAFVDADGLVDPARLAAATDDAARAGRHDTLHDGVSLSDGSFRLPYADPATARAMLPILAAAMQLLRAAPGQRVLDYGCGNGWLARLLALQGLEVTGVDRSQRAIDKGRAFTAVQQPQLSNRIRLSRLEEKRIPLPDQAVDRVIAFQSLHQVSDPASFLNEVFRVLSEGGVAVFVAHPAGHARSPEAQARMRAAGLAEHEVVLHEFWQLARQAGFASCEVMPVAGEALTLSLDDFSAAVGAAGNSPQAGGLAERILHGMAQGPRCFSLSRPMGTPDSREIPPPKARKKPLAALSLTSAQLKGERLVLTVAVRNTGEHRWLPGGSGPGGVNLGVGRRLADGKLEQDYRRVRLSQHEVIPGEALQVTFELDRRNAAGWVIDLVAEGITWFNVPLALDAEGQEQPSA